MGIKINTIIVLEDKKEYIILKEAMLQGKKYFLAMGLNHNREVIASDVSILEEYVSGVDTYVAKINDEKLMDALTNMFKEEL